MVCQVKTWCALLPQGTMHVIVSLSLVLTHGGFGVDVFAQATKDAKVGQAGGPESEKTPDHGSPGLAGDKDDASKVQLTFPDNVELKTVIDYVSTRLGVNILFDENVAKQQVTVRSPKPIDSDQLLPLLRSVLKFRGLALVDAEQAGWLTIVSADNIGEESRWSISDRPPTDDAHRVVTHVIKMKHADGKPFVELAESFLSKPGGNILSLPGGRTLIVTDYANVINRLRDLQAMIDRPGEAKVWKIRPLAHVGAGQAATLVQGIASKTGIIQQGSEGSGQSPFAIVPLPTANALILAGTKEQLEKVEKVVVAVDQKQPMVTTLYQLKHTSASRASSLVRQMIGPLQERSGGPGTWIINSDAEANALVITAPPEIHQQISLWIESTVDLPSDATPQGIATRVFTVKYARASELAVTLRSVFASGTGRGMLQLREHGVQAASTAVEDVQPGRLRSSTDGAQANVETEPGPSDELDPAPIFDEPTSDKIAITVDLPTNSIIATGSTTVLQQIERLIGRLDHHRPQVLVDVVIVSVNRTNTMDLGVELQYIKTDDGELSKGVLTSFGLVEAENLVDATTNSASATFGPGLTAVLLRSDELSVILRTLETRLDGQVLAKPQLLVADNETGRINSISEQPFTSINSGDTVSTTSFGGYAEAGTEVTITPHISESDIVHLDYDIVASSFTGASADGIPPPRATDSIASTVTIPSGYTLMVGGLTRTARQNTRRQVPILGDIPIIGEIFGSRNNTESEAVLYVFLKPVIHREDRFAYLKYVSHRAMSAVEIDQSAPRLEMEMIQ